MKKRQTRYYIQLSQSSIKCVLSAVEAFNKVYGDYKVETTLILLVNAWELLAKAILVKKKKSINRKDKAASKTISCEEAINMLFQINDLDKRQAELLQTIISLRNQCIHDVLPPVPEAVQHHLFFFSCKFFRDLLSKNFPTLKDDINKNFLTISFERQSTYASCIQDKISKLRRCNTNDKELIWLLERGVRYVDKNKYISQKEFEKLYDTKKKILPHLLIGSHLEESDMVCVIPVQAPQNFTADINLRKGSKNLKGTLPVTTIKSDPEKDYPFLANDLAKKIGKSTNFTSAMIKKMSLKNNKEYHLQTKSGKNTLIHSYSDKTLEILTNKLKSDPQFNPYSKS